VSRLAAGPEADAAGRAADAAGPRSQSRSGPRSWLTTTSAGAVERFARAGNSASGEGTAARSAARRFSLGGRV